MQEYAINTLVQYKVEDLQIGMTVGIVENDPWNNEKLVAGVVSSSVRTDSGEVLKVAIKNELTLRVEEVEAQDIEAIYAAFISDRRNPPQEAKKRVPNELHYVDTRLNPIVMKVGNPYNEGGEIITAITIEANGMAVIHSKSGIICVIKSNYFELYYV